VGQGGAVGRRIPVGKALWKGKAHGKTNGEDFIGETNREDFIGKTL
jgi:hypothetical protein